MGKARPGALRNTTVIVSTATGTGVGELLAATLFLHIEDTNKACLPGHIGRYFAFVDTGVWIPVYGSATCLAADRLCGAESLLPFFRPMFWHGVPGYTWNP